MYVHKKKTHNLIIFFIIHFLWLKNEMQIEREKKSDDNKN